METHPFRNYYPPEIDEILSPEGVIRGKLNYRLELFADEVSDSLVDDDEELLSFAKGEKSYWVDVELDPLASIGVEYSDCLDLYEFALKNCCFDVLTRFAEESRELKGTSKINVSSALVSEYPHKGRFEAIVEKIEE